MKFADSKGMDLHKNMSKVKETCVHACEIFRPRNKTTQEKVDASRSHCENEDRKFIVDCGVSLYTMSKKGLTSVK